MSINQTNSFENQLATNDPIFNFINLVENQNIKSIVNILQIPQITTAFNDCVRIANAIKNNEASIKNKEQLIRNQVIVANTKLLMPLFFIENTHSKIPVISNPPTTALLVEHVNWKGLELQQINYLASNLYNTEQVLKELDQKLREITNPSPLSQELGSDF